MYNDDNDLVQPTLGLTSAQMLERQNALTNVHTLEDWYRMYPQHARRWSHERPAQTTDRVAQAYERASTLESGKSVAFVGKAMVARYHGHCATCGREIHAGNMMRYDGKPRCYPECAPDTGMSEDDEIYEGSHGYWEEPNDIVSHPEEHQDSATTTVPDGKVTLEFEDGHYRTFRIVTQKADATFAPGERIVKYLAAPDNEDERSYRGFAFLKADGRLAVWKKFQGDTNLTRDAQALTYPQRAAELGLRYALSSGKCFRCGYTLTVPTSLHRGLGPECAKKGWL